MNCKSDSSSRNEINRTIVAVYLGNPTTIQITKINVTNIRQCKVALSIKQNPANNVPLL